MRVSSIAAVSLLAIGFAACAQRGASSLTPGVEALHRIDAAATGAYSVIETYKARTNGQDPQSPLAFYKGSFYGTVGGGSSTSTGQVFSFTSTPPGWSRKVLYTFNGAVDGAGPWQGLVVDAAGSLYGTTTGGGYPSCNCGTVFKIEKSGPAWKQTTLYQFKGLVDNDGGVPNRLTIDAHGNLFGMTSYGGSGSCVAGSYNHGCGYVFELSPSGNGAYHKSELYSFKGGNDGSYPTSALLAGAGGVFYGTTMSGGKKGCGMCGTVFELKPGTKGYTETVLYSFKGAPDGYNPTGALAFGKVSGTSVTLFGTTLAGGAGASACAPYTTACGTVFALHVTGTTAKKTILHNFVGGQYDGAAPTGAPLVSGSTLYGVTQAGGLDGTLWSVSESGTKFTLIHTFVGGNDGVTPNSDLSLQSGSIFGTTSQGGGGTCTSNGCGTIFRYAL